MKLLGIDIGTSGTKALLVDDTGRILKSVHREYPLSTPQPGWSEQNPEDWWEATQLCLAEIGEKPDAIGLTGQMHGSVFLDLRDEVIRPALLWNDQRTAAECAEIDSTVGAAKVREITANPPLTGFQLPKLLWIRRHEPAAYDRVKSLLLPKDFIRLKLTGERATEVSDASGTGIFDVPHRRWSAPMMTALGLNGAIFPACHESSVVSGKTADGIPVVGGGGDQAAGAVGTGAVTPGIVSVSLGTSGVVFVSQDQPLSDPAGATHTFCHANNRWHRMGVMLSCGGGLRWYRDTFAPGRSYDELAAEAANVPIGAEGLTFLPYLAGERCPHNDPTLRASFHGATLAHTQAHFTRAVFEGLTFGIKDCLRAVAAVPPSELRITGGGAKGAFWSQLLADATGIPCVTLEIDEGPAYGAALLAGVGIGRWDSVEQACRETIRTKHRIDPQGGDFDEAYARFRALGPV